MAILPIRKIGDEVLTKKTRRVTSIDRSVLKLIDDMVETMSAAPGVGLAANQVGKLLRIAVIQMPDEPVITLINPVVVKREGERLVEEGCLSIPGWHGETKRSATVKIRALDRNGKEFRLKGDGLLGQCLEHEIDHLDGILYTERLAEPGSLEKNEPEDAAGIPVPE
jgi:peptide deformylase